MLNTTFTDYYRCPENYGTFELPRRLSPDSRFFQVNGAVCYGRTSTGHRSQSVTDDLFDAFQAISVRQGACTLPFDPAEIAENLRCERYLRQPESARFLRNAYYLVRPAVPAGLRKLLQRDRKSTRLNSSHLVISYAVFCLKKKKTNVTERSSKHIARTKLQQIGCRPRTTALIEASASTRQGAIVVRDPRRLAICHSILGVK